MKKYLTFGVNTIKGAMKQCASKKIFVKIGGFVLRAMEMVEN